MNKILEDFVEPKKILGKDLRQGYYFYCAFPKKYGEPNMGYIEIIKIESWGKDQKMLWFNELKPSPMIVNDYDYYSVKLYDMP